MKYKLEVRDGTYLKEDGGNNYLNNGDFSNFFTMGRAMSMKDVTQKTDELIQVLRSLDFNSDTGNDSARMVVKLALKEQDRDTRHACAEAVITCNSVGGLISKSEAHNTCMNARAL